MHAVAEVNLHLEPPGRLVRHHVVDLRRTEARTGVAILFFAGGGADLGVDNLQMCGLVLIVGRPGEVDIGELVHEVGPVVLQLLAELWAALVIVADLLHVRVICGEGRDRAARPKQILKAPRHHSPDDAVLEACMEVLRPLHLRAHPATVDAGLVDRKLRLGKRRVPRVLGALQQPSKGGLCGEHSGLHRQVNALDSEWIEEARRVTDQHGAIGVNLRHARPATTCDGLRAILHDLTAPKNRLDVGVGFELLEQLMAVHHRVCGIERDQKTEARLVSAHAVQEPPAKGLHVEGIPEPVNGEAFGDSTFRKLKDLLTADLVGHRIAVSIELTALDELACQVAARALAENGHRCREVHARLKVIERRSVWADALVARADTTDRIAVPEQVHARKLWEDVDALLFGELSHPRAELAQADDRLAKVVHLWRHKWRLEVARLGEKHHVVALDVPLYRDIIALPPVWHELIERKRIEHRAGELMRTDT